MTLDAFVTDTNPLVFYATDAPRKLSKLARRLFERAERGQARIYVPAAVSLEIWLLHRGGRISVPTTLPAWWRTVDAFGVVHAPLTHEDVVAAVALDWTHADIFDRSIVAIARRLGLPLLTADAEITDSALVDVVW